MSQNILDNSRSLLDNILHNITTKDAEFKTLSQNLKKTEQTLIILFTIIRVCFFNMKKVKNYFYPVFQKIKKNRSKTMNGPEGDL